jgi:hypothetical protein
LISGVHFVSVITAQAPQAVNRMQATLELLFSQPSEEARGPNYP